jgi:AraC-like DNA-binding protein
MSRSQVATAGPDAPVARERFALLGIQDTHDPCHWESVSQPWEVLATPLDGRPFRNHKVFVATPNCILYRESFASPVRVQVLSPEGMLAILVPVQLGSRSGCFNRSLETCALPAMLPGAAEAVLDAGHEHFMLLIRLGLLRRLLAEPHWVRLERAAATRRLDLSPRTRQRLAGWLGALLDRVHGAAAMLEHPAAVDALEGELVQGLSEALELTGDSGRPARSAVRRRGFDRAIEHIRHADLGVLDLPTLALAAGISRRSLEYAFQEHLGLSPSRFLRLLRLHGLRRELLARQLGEATIGDLAHHLGFTQLGRLAGEYHMLFGEPPSATLARPFSNEAPRFWEPRFDSTSRSFFTDGRTAGS